MQLGRVVFARHSWQGLSDVLWSLACLGLDARQATTRLQKLELSGRGSHTQEQRSFRLVSVEDAVGMSVFFVFCDSDFARQSGHGLPDVLWGHVGWTVGSRPHTE